MKKTLITTLTAALFGVSSYALAAPTEGNLNFSFQGVIPAEPSSPGEWGFFDTSGGEYRPGNISLSGSKLSDGSYQFLMDSPEIFYIKPKSGAFTASSNIQATLAATSLSGTGLTGDTSTIIPSININGETLSNSAQSIGAATGGQVRIALTGNVVIPVANINTKGGNMTMTSAIIFSADITG